MLVLSRKSNQKIKIGDEIEIQVLSCSDDRVRLGIKAPKSLSVHREEVYERIANALASNAGDDA
ncbi:MAG: carbon storage regulator [Gammaproteobacteria bacterium CG11_big_fil_rev_8_21_14_0_20_46_22]|nr:MAG: carbon storage regulator [Gammaproteobacteria bacterium CG12_big_fil_rev_8_21_14_0_65_46_12]PIR11100.1 MAG: carbon storage regulator [Gammaproteobacteria bacterium CG11_big_fil_rev_8_21_14_0_20_46_22]